MGKLDRLEWDHRALMGFSKEFILSEAIYRGWNILVATGREFEEAKLERGKGVLGDKTRWSELG